MTCTSATLAPAEDDFKGGNIDRPYISGSHYNGKAKPEFFDPKNMIKGFKFRFGQLLKFVEKTGIWLSDPSGNELHLDEETKSTTLTVPETATIRAKNIIFEATESITFRAGTHIYETAILNKTTIIGGGLSTSVTGDNFLRVDGSSQEYIEGDFHSEIKKDRNTISHSEVVSESYENVEFHSQSQIQNNSSEGTMQN